MRQAGGATTDCDELMVGESGRDVLLLDKANPIGYVALYLNDACTGFPHHGCERARSGDRLRAHDL